MVNPRDTQCKSLVMGLGDQVESLHRSPVCLFCCLQDARDHCTWTVCWEWTWDSTALDPSKGFT